jgi:DNA invertase Pin-like site-specific DNA recombinase
MKNVVAYTRVSTDAQAGEDRFGLDAQRQQILEYCEKNDMHILKWYEDAGESGAKQRPGFDEIVYGEVTNPPVEAVIVAKTDRVARDVNVYFYYKMLLKKKDMELISIAEDFGQLGVFAPMLESFVICAAQMERDNITKRMSGGRRVKAAKGGYAGGRAPMGYKIVDGGYVIEEREAALVRRIFELRAEGLPMRAIADRVNAEGFTGRNGCAVSFSTVSNILGNEKTYRGWYHYGKTGEWVRGLHEPILTDDEWKRSSAHEEWMDSDEKEEK